MRDASLKQNLLRGVSLAAVHMASSVSPVRKVESCLAHGASSFLARIGLWLRLIFGLGVPRCESVSLPDDDYTVNREKRRAFVHRAKRRSSARKAPAHDLEMLMRFVPGARRGLTLNQYRERLTRISVLSRTQIYVRAQSRCFSLLRQFMAQLGVAESMAVPCHDICAAPLWPD